MSNSSCETVKFSSKVSWIFTLAIAYTICCSGISCINPYFPKVCAAKGISESVVGMVISMVCVPQLVLMFWLEKLILKYGPRCVFNVGLVLYSIGTMLFGLVNIMPNLTIMIITCFAFKFIQGIGYSLVTTTSVYIISEYIPEKDSLAMGIMETGSGIGYGVGPFFGGIFYDNISFSAPLIFYGILSFLILIVSLFTLQEFPPFIKHDTDCKTKKAVNYWKFHGIYFIFMMNMLAFCILANYDVTLPMFVTLTLNRSSTLAGMILLVYSICYGSLAFILGFLIEKTKHKKVIVITSSVLVMLAFASFIAVAEAIKQVTLVMLVVTMFLLSLTVCFYVPTLCILKKYFNACGVIDSRERNAFISTGIICFCVLGQMVGNATGGVFFQHLGPTYTASFFLCVTAVFTLLFSTVKQAKQCTKEVYSNPECSPLLNSKEDMETQ